MEHYAVVPTSLLGPLTDLDRLNGSQITEDGKTKSKRFFWATEQSQEITSVLELAKRPPTERELFGMFLIILFIAGLIAVVLFSPLQPV